MRKLNKISQFLALSVGLVCGSAYATVYDWDYGASNNNWNSAANWNPDGTPGASDSVVQTATSGSFVRANVAGGTSVTNYTYNAAGTFGIYGDSSTTPRTLTVSGTLSTGTGAGLLTIRNSSGTLALTATNITLNANISFGDANNPAATNILSSLTSTGTTTINGSSTLLLNTASASLGDVTISSSGAVYLNVSGSATGANISRIVSMASLSSSNSSALVAGSRVSNNGVGLTTTLQLTSSSGTATYAGQLVDNAYTGTGNSLSLVKLGGGTQILSGNNTYSGATTIQAGTLLVNNTGGSGMGSGTVSVQTGGTLGGTGFIGGAVRTLSGGAGSSNNGHLSPGLGGAGTLTINNTLTIADHSYLDLDLNQADAAAGTAGNDQLRVAGTNGSNGDLTIGTDVTINLAAGSDFGAGVYHLITYTGTLLDNSGGFSGWNVQGLTAGESAAFQVGSNGTIDMIVAVPEVASIGLLGLALAAIGLLRRHSSK